ncbi:hypothetical protein BDV98DRAFT_574901 [Pterulicium gracile]|uniref:Uncharacterized protein n=1 Tax=Pterulicium gracile TaxID=1884261 RepID=A0A5C3QG38_9AGAR|nr:hypothetical protein BDV98DRAFT_574901 [Pterula gracilis]
MAQVGSSRGVESHRRGSSRLAYLFVWLLEMIPVLLITLLVLVVSVIVYFRSHICLSYLLVE